MEAQYESWARKLKPLCRPRIDVQASHDGILVHLLPAKDPQGQPLLSYAFQFKGKDSEPPKGDTLKAMSAFLEMAAIMLHQRPKGKHPIIFSQELYNNGFWTNPAEGSRILTCEAVAIDYDEATWDA